MNDPHRHELLKWSAAYATARLSFAMRGDGDVTGYTVPVIRAVLR